MVCFFAQDVKQFNGLPNVGYGPVFYLALLFTLGSFLLCGCMINDDVNGNKARLVNGMTKQARSEIMSKSGNGLQDPIDRMKIPTSAPFGYSFFTPPHNQTVTITTYVALPPAPPTHQLTRTPAHAFDVGCDIDALTTYFRSLQRR